MAALFNPRTQDWRQHFHWVGARIEPLTPEARVTVRILRLNDPQRVREREALRAGGLDLARHLAK